MSPSLEHDHEARRAQILQHMKSLFQIEDSTGLELFITLQRVAHLSEALECQNAEETELSGARLRLMMRLLAEGEMGNHAGVTPTVLSHFQRVSKNTVSALLRGLEEQGLIRRNLDPDDLRVFRIQLTDAGRELVLKTAPRRIEWINELLSGLEPEERVQLAALLEKLSRTLRARIQPHDRPY